MRKDDWKLPWEGGCRCDALKVKVTSSPLLTGACHCKGCQKMTGGAYSLTVAVPADGFEVTKGEPVIGGLHGTDARHHHCDLCKSWVFTRVPGMEWFVNLRATMLDDCRWFVPFIELWTDERLPTANTGASRSFAQGPELEQFATLIAEFAAEGVRP